MASNRKSRVAGSIADGSIVRIRLKDFLTYDDVEVFPGPNLNVIIGPNGTGKSTIVCAIALGLGGSPSILGRSKHLVDYIKHDKDRAVIEIELQDSHRNPVIQRILRKPTGTDWYLNGKKCPEGEVLALTRKYRIQVDNLCQFLAQDRVVEFSKQSSTELLQNTELAVGVDLYEKHQLLINKKTHRQTLKAELKKSIEAKDQASRRINEVQPDVQNFQKRKQFEKAIVVLNKKRPWIAYDAAREERVTAEKAYKAAVEQMKVEKNRLEPLKRQLDDAKKRSTNVDKSVKENKVKLDQKRDQIGVLEQQYDNAEDKINDHRRDVDSKKAEEADRQRRINETHIQIASLTESLQQCDDENLKPLLDELGKKVSELDSTFLTTEEARTSLVHSMRSVEANYRAVENELTHYRDETARLDNHLSRIDGDAYKALQWYKLNQQMFKAPIHGPIMLCIKVKNPEDTKFVETPIARRDMVSFVCEDGQDSDLFVEQMRKNLHLAVNCATVPREPMYNFRSEPLNQQMKAFGFKGYVSDLFDAPEGVKKYLCRLTNLHRIPVGDQSTEDHMDQITEYFAEKNLRQFFTPNKRVSIKKSKYGGNISTAHEDLRQPYLIKNLSNSEQMTAAEEKVQALKEDLTRMSEQKKQYEVELRQTNIQKEKLKQERAELMQRQGKKVQIQSQLRSKTAQLEKLEATDLRLDQFVEAQKNKMAQLMEAMESAHLKICKLQKEMGTLNELMSVTSIGNLNEQRVIDDLDQEYTTASETLQTLEETVKRLATEKETAKVEALRLLAAAKEACDLPRNDISKELPEELIAAFAPLPNTLDEIDQMLNEQQARLECCGRVDGGLMREYVALKKKVETLEVTVAQQQLELDNFQEEVGQRREEWLEPLKQLIERISTNYSRFFSNLGCAGEVELDMGSDPEDYAQYGIKLKVKFRDEESLRDLTSQRQSGGERSVSTILYMLALQELSQVPFRCVDEINQGMDPVNERKVFQMMVKLLSGADEMEVARTQYFMLTPKLLPDLEYSERMNVLCVHNGSAAPESSKWNVKRQLQRAKS